MIKCTIVYVVLYILHYDMCLHFCTIVYFPYSSVCIFSNLASGSKYMSIKFLSFLRALGLP